MKLFDESNHRTAVGKRFADRVDKEPVVKLCARYLKKGASTAEMMQIVNTDLQYALAMLNAQRSASRAER